MMLMMLVSVKGGDRCELMLMGMYKMLMWSKREWLEVLNVVGGE